MRAADKWDSPRFIGSFLASGLYWSQAESHPTHQRVTPAVGRLAKSIERQDLYVIESNKS